MPDVLTLPGGFQSRSRRLNVGCGFDIRDGYINVDLNDFHKPDVVADIVYLDDFPAGEFDEVFAKDVIEHFLWRATPVALRSWNRILRVGGKLILTTTYLPGLAKRILSSSYQADLALQHVTLVNLFSMQSYPGDFHYTAFTEGQLRYQAAQAGFTVENITLKDGWLIQATMVKASEKTFPDPRAGTASDYVKQVYRDVLGRESDQPGLDHWIKAIDTGKFDRKGVLLEFMGSRERQKRDLRLMSEFDVGPLTLGV